MPDGTATAHLYRPKLLTVVREGYGAARLFGVRAYRREASGFSRGVSRGIPPGCF